MAIAWRIWRGISLGDDVLFIRFSKERVIWSGITQILNIGEKLNLDPLNFIMGKESVHTDFLAKWRLFMNLSTTSGLWRTRNMKRNMIVAQASCRCFCSRPYCCVRFYIFSNLGLFLISSSERKRPVLVGSSSWKAAICHVGYASDWLERTTLRPGTVNPETIWSLKLSGFRCN